MYGVEIRNKDLSLFLGTYETTFMYWGYKDVTHTNGTDTYIDLFGIPVGYDIQIYTYCNTQGEQYPYLRALHVTLDGTGSTWRGLVNFWMYSGTARIYVFASAKAINLPKYGLAIYDTAGNVRFHSARPPVSIKLLGEVIYSQGQHRTNCSFKPACKPTIARVDSEYAGTPGQYYVEYSRFNGFYNSGEGGYQHGWTLQTQGPRGGPSRYQPADVMNYAVIDASYYEQFPNLGNFPQ